ncbi:MAG TPA: allantoinase AllB [Bryobacteraceae bacterium]|nr:allantoinase AllB [Bryobacteraceae bacterium]
MTDLVIRGGQVVVGQDVVAADIAIEDGLISAVGPGLPGAKKEMDASGLTILPGLIDVHVHFNDPGRADWESAETGSRAFAAGGGTLFFDMPLNSSPCTVTAAGFAEKRAVLERSSVTNFGLWGGIVPGNRDDLAELADCGAIGFKAFLCDSGLPEFPRADDLTLYEGMREAARLGLPVAVHAESEEITKGLSKRLMAEGRCDIPAFLESRPVIAEVEAIERAALLARETGCKLHVVHISSGRGVGAALEARARGTDISIETCPHYLFFTEEDLLRVGAVLKCAPPLRSVDERDALWSFVTGGQVDIIGSDHSPCPPSMKQKDNFFSIWGGIAGIQSTLAVLVQRGSPLPKIAAMTAANGARRFGIANRGSIEAGAHADLAFADVTATHTLRAEALLQRHRVSPYVGHSFRGAVRQAYRDGELIFADGAIVSESYGKLVTPK